MGSIDTLATVVTDVTGGAQPERGLTPGFFDLLWITHQHGSVLSAAVSLGHVGLSLQAVAPKRVLASTNPLRYPRIRGAPSSSGGLTRSAQNGSVLFPGWLESYFASALRSRGGRRISCELRQARAWGVRRAALAPKPENQVSAAACAPSEPAVACPAGDCRVWNGACCLSWVARGTSMPLGKPGARRRERLGAKWRSWLEKS